MFFKHAQIYRLPQGWKPTAEAMEQQLSRRRFTPCGSQDMQSRGWVAPADGGLAHAFGDCYLLAMVMEQKLLPTAVINQEAEKRAADIAKEQGYPVGRKQMRELKERVKQELLPRAFTRKHKTSIWIDTKGGWLVVNAGNASKAEEALELLGKCLDEFPVARLHTSLSPAAAMTGWLADSEAPGGFTVDRDCELRSPAEEKATVRYLRHTLEGDEVRQHIVGGKMPTRLGMTWNDRLSFVLTEKLEVKNIHFLDIVREEAERQAENAAEQFEADLALMGGEFSRFIPDLVAALGGEAA